jgi:hypothetical protein
MKLRIEDLEVTRSREEQVDFLDMRQLHAFFIRWSQLNELSLYVLLKGRGKFIEVWSSDGSKLLERYTRTDK